MAEKMLKNRTIVITRAEAQVNEFAAILGPLGARTIAVPVIEISPLDSTELQASLNNINRYAWIIFTSVNGAEIFLKKLKETISPDDLAPLICAIGPGTAKRVREMGFSVSFIPRIYQAEGLTEEFLTRSHDNPASQSILIPRAEQAREILPETLTRIGFDVEVIPVYRTEFPAARELELKELLNKSAPDMITFTSSSTVTNFIRLAGDDFDFNSCKFASIGPITSETAAKAGINIDVKASESTLISLAEAIAEYYS